MKKFKWGNVDAPFPSPFRALFGFALGIFFTLQLASATGLYSGGSGDVFYSVGVDQSGTVVVSGRRGNQEGFFELNNGGFNFTPLQPARVMPDRGVVLSRNGRFVISRPEIGAPQCWERGSTLTSEPVPDILQWESITDVAGENNEPMLIGTVLDGFLELPAVWSRSRGPEDLSEVWGSGTPLYFISRDGHIVGGGSRWGEGVINFGTRTNVSVLFGEGNDNFDVKGFSPNGRYIATDFARSIFSQTVIWTDRVPRLLAQPDDLPARASSGISDSGFVGGQGRSLTGDKPGDGLAFIFDPRAGRSVWFQDWWQDQPSPPPLREEIKWVNDLYESGGQLYLLLQTKSEKPLLAAVPIQSGDGPVLEIRLSGARVQVTWPSTASPVIETTTSLINGWSPVPGTPVVSGPNWLIELPAVDRTQFFRVKGN